MKLRIPNPEMVANFLWPKCSRWKQREYYILFLKPVLIVTHLILIQKGIRYRTKNGAEDGI